MMATDVWAFILRDGPSALLRMRAGKRKIIFMPVDNNPKDYILDLSRPVYEGRLISVVRRGAGCGGRQGRWRFDANTLPAVQAASVLAALTRAEAL
jgi:hypothetical protein